MDNGYKQIGKKSLNRKLILLTYMNITKPMLPAVNFTADGVANTPWVHVIRVDVAGSSRLW